MFKFFKWTVLLRSNESGFFVAPTPPGYLCRLSNSDRGVVPFFGKDPSLYTFERACFLVSELRRVGYYVDLFPYGLILLKAAIVRLRARLAAAWAAKRVWKK